MGNPRDTAATDQPRPLDRDAIRLIAARFPGRWLQGYVRGKLRSDPLYAAVTQVVLAAPAPILDIGCGIGLLGHYLRESGHTADYLGLDLDAHKIAIAKRAAARSSGLRFVAAASDSLPAWQGHVALLDVLHYLGPAQQQAVLQSAAERIAPGASLIIRNVLRDESWRFAFTRLEELFMRSIRWMRYGVQHYPHAEGLRAPLAAAGLNVMIRPLWAGTPFNSYMIIARRSNG